MPLFDPPLLFIATSVAISQNQSFILGDAFEKDLPVVHLLSSTEGEDGSELNDMDASVKAVTGKSLAEEVVLKVRYMCCSE